MVLRSPKILLILPVFTFLAFADDAVRPVCTAKNLGLLWPEQANKDPKLMGTLARCGELSICTRRTWRYRWDSAVVTLDQLRHRQTSLVKPGCEVVSNDKALRLTPEMAH
jgi:hypothetical protein